MAQKKKKLLHSTLTADRITGAFDADLSYHAAAPGGEGWVYLERVATGEREDVYYFGYHRKLSPGDETVTLFDQVQLKSFIDGEVSSYTGGEDPVPFTIDVTCYGIQAENLDTEALDPPVTVDWTKTHLDENELRAILAIVKNKAAVTPAPAPPEP